MSYRGHDDPQRSDWRRYEDRRERPSAPRDFSRESRGSPLGLDRGGRRDHHHQNDLEGLKIRISNSGRHAEPVKMSPYDDLPVARGDLEESRHLTRRYDAPKESDGLKITVGNERYRDSAERRFSDRHHDDRQHFSHSPEHRPRSHSVRSDSVRSKSPTPSRAADFGRGTLPDLEVDFKGPSIDMNILNPHQQQDDTLKKAQDLEKEFYKRLSSPFLMKQADSPAPPLEKPFIPGTNLDTIDDEDAFLYGESSEPTPKRSASPLGLPPAKKRGLFDEEAPVHAPVPQPKKMVFEYDNQEKCEPSREPTKKAKVQAKNLYDDKEAAKADYDPTIENILKSIGFNFELSKQTQEKAKREREASFSVDESSSFMEGGVDMAALFQEKLKEAEQKAVSESKVSSQPSYEEKARRYREELIQKAKAEMQERTKPKPSNLFEAEEERLASFTSTIDLSLPPISGPMKVERKAARPEVRATSPSGDPDAEWERRRQEFLKKLQQPRLEETIDKKRTVLPPKEVKRTVRAKEPESVKKIIKEKEQLARDYEEKEKRLRALDKELERLRKQQNEMMRKKQRDRDVHRDPLLLANTKLQEDIALQIKALRQAADKGGGKDLDKYESLSSSDSDDFTEKKTKLIEQKKKVFMKPKSNPVPDAPVKQPIEEKKPFVKRMHYEYFDGGSHWCQQCNIVTNTIFDLFEHLHSKGHQSRMDLFSRPWASGKFKNETPKAPGMKSVHTEIKGVEFMIPTQAYFCNLCKEFSGDSSSAEQHLKAEKHNEKYRQYVEDNQFYEKRLALDRAAGMAGGKETKKVEKKKEKKVEIPKKEEVKVHRLSAHRENVQEANKKSLRARRYSSSGEEVEEGVEVEEEEDMRFIGPKENDDRSKINIKFTQKPSNLPAKKSLKEFVKKQQEKVLIGATKQPVIFGKMRQAATKEKKEVPLVKKDIGMSMFSDPVPKVALPQVGSIPRVLVTSQLKVALTPPKNSPPKAEAKLPSPERLLPPGIDQPPSPPPPLPTSVPESKENGEQIAQEENGSSEVIEDPSSECELLDMGSDFEILDECDAD